MHNHAPKDYRCPICLGVQKKVNADTLLLPDDLVYKDEQVSVFINSFLIDRIPGRVIVVPNKHIENIYDLSAEDAAQIMKIARKIALAMKRAYDCEGITFLQNNEPAGDQHAFHYHLHIFPRYFGDELHKHMQAKTITPLKERKKCADMLKSALSSMTEK